MNKKRLDRDKKWGFEKFPYYQFHMEHELFHGLVSIIYLTDGQYCYWNMEKAGKSAVAGAGMLWLQLIPDGKKHVMTAKILPNKEVSIWYVDVIEDWGYDTDGVAIFTDKYLDVIFNTKGDLKIDDREELDAGFASGDINKEQYEAALKEGDEIVKLYCQKPEQTEKWCQNILEYAEKQIQQGLMPFKMKNIIFLDIDGVLDVPDPSKQIPEFIPETLDYLKEIVNQTNAKIVIISTWRLGAQRLQEMYPENEEIKAWKVNWDYLMDTFRKHDLYIEDNTDWNKNLKSRGEEIRAFLVKHPDVNSYIIIDDCYHDCYEAQPELHDRLVMINGAKGMEKHHIEEAVKLLKDK